MRKKNAFDPLANPVWFFKGEHRDPASEKMLNLNHLDKAIKAKYQREQEMYGKQEEKMGIRRTRPVSAAPLQQKNEDGSLKKPKKKVSYTTNWKSNCIQFDSNVNADRDDF